MANHVRLPVRLAGLDVARTNEGGATKKWMVAIVPLTVQVFFVALLYYIILYLVGVYVSDKGLGDEAFTGLLTSILTISTAIGSIAFGFFYKALKNKVYIPGLLAIAAAFFILSWTDSQIVAAMTLALAGLGWAFYFCFFYTYCTELVPNAKTAGDFGGCGIEWACRKCKFADVDIRYGCNGVDVFSALPSFRLCDARRACAVRALGYLPVMEASLCCCLGRACDSHINI